MSECQGGKMKLALIDRYFANPLRALGDVETQTKVEPKLRFRGVKLKKIMKVRVPKYEKSLFYRSIRQ